MRLAPALLACGAVAAADLPPDKYKDWTIEQEVFVPMRDGAHLSADVLLPKGASEKLPTILIRTPYYVERAPTGRLRELFLRQGYALVVENERGLVFSEGYYKNYLQGANTDGYDTLDWIVKQPWSNGKVGSIGCSSSGETQWLMAARNHPAHAAMIPAGSWAVGNIPGNHTLGAFYRGGVPMYGPWVSFYGHLGTSERLVLPPNSTQEERVRLRTSYSLVPTDFFDASGTQSGPLDVKKLLYLPSGGVLRSVNVVRSPWENYISWTPGDARWKDVELIDADVRPRVPALHISTWYDPAAVETTRLFKHLQDLGTPNQHLIIGSESHCSMFQESMLADLPASESLKLSSQNEAGINRADLKVGDAEVGDVRYGGEDAGYPKLFLRWFGHWLNGDDNNVADMPKVQLHVMNEGWVSGDRWPLRETRFTKYFLGNEPRVPAQESGLLSPDLPNHDGHDSYIYDPGTPTPSLGGGCCGTAPALDQRSIEIRKDVLSYTSARLEKPLTIAGPVEADLYVSSTAKDTDFMVRVVDVYPDGKAVNFTDDAFRVRYRDGFDKKVLMESGKVYKISLTNMVAAIRFPKGHRIRLDVSSSSFPLYERNLNTGGNNYDETSWLVAENAVHHGGKYASYVLLPLLPD